MASDGVLLLGAAGFVGTSLLSHLSKKKYKIYSLSTRDISVSSSSIISYISSLDNKEVLKEILPKCKIVFYLASHSTPGFSAHQPTIEAESNLLPCLRFLEILEEYKDVLLVYLSSGGAVYGDSLQGVFSEDLPLRPRSYYGAGKAAIEKFILAYQAQTDNKVLILRPSNFYGPGQEFREGFGIVPTLYSKIIKKSTVSIWGSGEAIRDYLHIDDFINLCEIIINKQVIPAERRRVYNVGSGFGISLNDLIILIEIITGEKIIRKYTDVRKVDVNHSILNSERIKKDYQWSSDKKLTQGLMETWQWFKREFYV